METIQGYNVIDLLILLTLLIGLILGVWKGFVRSVTALASVVLGVLAAMHYYPSVEPYLGKISKLDPQISMILSMIIIFVLVQIAFVLLRLLLEAAIDVSRLGWLDRSFGALMGVLAATVLIVTAVQGLVIAAPDMSAVKKSQLVPVANRIWVKCMDYMPQKMKDRLNKSIQEWKGVKRESGKKPVTRSAPPAAPQGEQRPQVPERALPRTPSTEGAR